MFCARPSTLFDKKGLMNEAHKPALKSDLFDQPGISECTIPEKPFLPDNFQTYNMNDNLKNNILLLENIRQKGLTIVKYFDAYNCHYYQPKIIQ